MSSTELTDFVTIQAVERIYRRAVDIHNHVDDNRSQLRQGMRAARARDPKLLTVLERGADLLDKLADEQYGRTRRDPGTAFSARVPITEAKFWAEAFRLADQGDPLPQASHLYAAAGEFAGVVQ